MATFTKTYKVNLGDRIEFRTSDKNLIGIVQDIIEFPEICVEVGNPKSPNYKRYRTSINMIVENYSCDDWLETETIFERDEPLDFVYDSDYNIIISNSFKNK